MIRYTPLGSHPEIPIDNRSKKIRLLIFVTNICVTVLLISAFFGKKPIQFYLAPLMLIMGIDNFIGAIYGWKVKSNRYFSLILSFSYLILACLWIFKP